MSEEKQTEVVTKENSVRFHVEVTRHGADIATIGAYVSLPGCPNVRWSQWAFSKCDETGVKHIVFASPSGATAIVDAASVARPSLEGLRLYDETVLRLRRRGQTSSALLWSCVIERMVALKLVASSLAAEHISAELLSACKEGVGLS